MDLVHTQKGGGTSRHTLPSLSFDPEPADEAMRAYLETFHGRMCDTGKKKCGLHDTERKKIMLNNNM